MNQTAKKQPDEFFTVMDRVVHFLDTYKLTVIAVVLVAIIGSIVFLFLKSSHEKSLLASNQELHDILSLPDSESQAKLESLANSSDDSIKGVIARVTLLKKSIADAQFDKALVLAEALQKDSPDFLRPYVTQSYIELLWQNGKNDQALSEIEKVRGRFPKKVSLYLDWTKAQILLDSNSSAEAKSLLEDIISKSEDDNLIKSKAKALLSTMADSGISQADKK